ncbi:MAG: sigma-70 family RNA polymerase sigma factor [Actinomycetota bacterium]
MDEPGAAVVTGAPASFEVFFEAHRHRLHGALTLMTANAQEAEELTQDAFLVVWERWDRVGAMDRPDGYLYRVAMNAFRKRWRRMHLDVRLRARAEDERDPFERAAEKDEVARALALLPRRERAALVLTELLELDSNETGELLGIKPATVRVLTHRARDRVRRAMGDEDG